ncbi:MAG: PEGA domain-containing protein [bacterium]
MIKRLASVVRAFGYLAVFLLLASTAQAQMDPLDSIRVAILPVAAPEITYLDTDKFTEIVVRTIKDSGLEPVVISKLDSALVDQQCLDLACLTDVGKRAGALRVISVRILPVGRFYSLSLRVANVAQAHMEAARQQRIENQDDLAATVEWMTREVIGGFLAEVGRLRIATVPTQSAIYLGGNPIGLSPVELELPSGDYHVRAVRSGYGDKNTQVHVVAGDTVSLTLTLSLPTVGLDQQHYKTPTRLLLWGGLPIQAESPFIGNKVSIGAMMLYGDTYRVGLSAFTHREVLNVDESIWRDYGATKAPEGWTMVLSASIIFAPLGDRFTPLFGLGLAALQRKVTVTLESGTQSWENDMEIGGIFLVGLDIPISGRFFLETVFANVFAGGKNPTNDDYSTEPHQIWRDGFDSLRSFSSLRFTFGMIL